MTIIETVVSGLILAFISGLTYVGYKHPRGFRKMVLLVFPAPAILASFYIVSKIVEIQVLIRSLGEEVTKSPADRLERYVFGAVKRLNQELTALEWTLGIAVVIVTYLGFLYLLPNILSQSSEEKNLPEKTETNAQPTEANEKQ